MCSTFDSRWGWHNQERSTLTEMVTNEAPDSCEPALAKQSSIDEHFIRGWQNFYIWKCSGWSSAVEYCWARSPGLRWLRRLRYGWHWQDERREHISCTFFRCVLAHDTSKWGIVGRTIFMTMGSQPSNDELDSLQCNYQFFKKGWKHASSCIVVVSR